MNRKEKTSSGIYVVGVLKQRKLYLFENAL